MAPAAKHQSAQHQAQHDFDKDEKCLCFHGQYLYEAKILDKEHEDPKDRKSPWRYRVHYKGWKNTWDDWVHGDRLRKLNEENKEFARSLFADLRQKQKEEREAKEAVSRKSIVGGLAGQKKKSLGGSELGSLRGSEERSSSAQAVGPSRGTKRGRDWEGIEKEESFTTRPSVRIPLPDHLKGLLVDDWENVTKQLTLVPLPHAHPVSAILEAYVAAEMPRRRAGSADADILVEVAQGVREYFDKCLGRILLYRFERQQWLEVHERMGLDASPAANNSSNSAAADEAGNASDEDATSPTANLAGKTPADVYGAEHLCRLFVSMPELIAQTNMDAQSVGRLREELAKLTQWLARNSAAYFTKVYVDPGSEYMERAKGTG